MYVEAAGIIALWKGQSRQPGTSQMISEFTKRYH
jgi:hypothetical protein